MFPTNMHMEAEISLRLLSYRTFSDYKIHTKTCDPNASPFSILTYYTKQHELNAWFPLWHVILWGIIYVDDYLFPK